MFGTPLHRLQRAWDGRGSNREVAVLAGDVCDVSDQFPDINKLPSGHTVMLPVSDLQSLLSGNSKTAPARPTQAAVPKKRKPKSQSAVAE